MQTAINADMIHLSERVNAPAELEDIDALVRLYRPRLLRYVTYSLGDQDLAETITQDCLLKAWNGRSHFRGDSSVSTWLFSIANNLIRDHLRTKKFQFWRKAKANALDVTEMAGILASGETSAESRLLARERAAQVLLAVEDLSANQKRVFLLRFSEEMDLAEIAEVTGMSLNTVKTHMHRAVSAIRAKLGGPK